MAARQYAVNNEQIAARQDSLRRETLQALKASPHGLVDALKWWPSPRAEEPVAIPVGSAAHARAQLASRAVSPPRAPNDNCVNGDNVQPIGSAGLVEATSGFPLPVDADRYDSSSTPVMPTGRNPSSSDAGDATTCRLSSLQSQGSEVPTRGLCLVDGPAQPLSGVARCQDLESYSTAATVDRDFEVLNCADAARQAFAAEHQVTSADVAREAFDTEHQGEQYQRGQGQMGNDGKHEAVVIAAADEVAEVAAGARGHRTCRLAEATLAASQASQLRPPSRNKRGRPVASGHSSPLATLQPSRLSPPKRWAHGSNKPASPRASSPPPRAGNSAEKGRSSSSATLAREAPVSEDNFITNAEMDSDMQELLRFRRAVMRIEEALSPQALRELRLMQRPSGVVTSILETLVSLLGKADTSWHSIRRVLQSNLVEHLRSFNPEEVTLGQSRRLHGLLTAYGNDDESIRANSPAVLPIMNWCKAVGTYLAGTGFGSGFEPEQAHTGKVGSSLLAPVGTCQSDASLECESRHILAANCAAERDLGRDGSVAEMSQRREPDADRMDAIVIEPDPAQLTESERREVLELEVSRPGISSIVFHGYTDITGLDIPRLVHLDVGEVLVYPEVGTKPPVGEGLNKRATVTMHRCFPPNGRDQLSDERSQERYRQKIKHMTEEKGATFLDYNYNAGIWVFQVEHF